MNCSFECRHEWRLSHNPGNGLITRCLAYLSIGGQVNILLRGSCNNLSGFASLICNDPELGYSLILCIRVCRLGGTDFQQPELFIIRNVLKWFSSLVDN